MATVTSDGPNGTVMPNLEADQLEEEQLRAASYRIQMYKLVIPVFLGLSLLAILANALVILALRSARVRRNATVTLLLSLTSSDIWSSIVMGLSLLYNSYLPIVLQTHVDPCLALSLEMLRTGGLLTAALHLLLIALHHCVGIIRPHCDKSFLRRGALGLCALAWVAPPGALWLLALSQPGQGFWNCERVDFYHSRAFRWAVSALLGAIFCAITLCYAKLLCILRSQHGKWPKLQSATGSCRSGTSAVVAGQPASSVTTTLASASTGERKRRRRQRRTLWTTLLICASFLLGWAPASVLFALTCADCRVLAGPGLYRMLFALSCVQLAFLLAKSLLNPLIYSTRIPEVNTQIRQCMLNGKAKLLKYWCSTSAQSSRCPTVGVNALQAQQKLKKLKHQRSHLFNSSFSSAAREEHLQQAVISARRQRAATMAQMNGTEGEQGQKQLLMITGNGTERATSTRSTWVGAEEQPVVVAF